MRNEASSTSCMRVPETPSFVLLSYVFSRHSPVAKTSADLLTLNQLVCIESWKKCVATIDSREDGRAENDARGLISAPLAAYRPGAYVYISSPQLSHSTWSSSPSSCSSLYGNFPSRMPLACTCSAAISAASYSPLPDDEGAYGFRVLWDVVSETTRVWVVAPLLPRGMLYLCYATRYLNNKQTQNFALCANVVGSLLMKELRIQNFLLKPLIVALWLVAITRYYFLLCPEAIGKVIPTNTQSHCNDH